MPISEQSAIDTVPAVDGKNTATTGTGARVGVEGESNTGWGVYGHSVDGRGVVASSESSYGLRARSTSGTGLRASSDQGRGMEGVGGAGEGVVGTSETSNAVVGLANGGGAGVVGISAAGIGVVGESQSPGGAGVRGVSRSNHGGVVGVNEASFPGGNGGWFESQYGEGVRGVANHSNHGAVVGEHRAGGTAVFGTSADGVALYGSSVRNEGVHAETESTVTAAMAVYQKNAASSSAALFVKHEGNKLAAFFHGDVAVTGDISLVNADCAEEFDIAAGPVEPGTVMVIDNSAVLRTSDAPYDKRVAGVIAGAGQLKPGLVLDRQAEEPHRQAIALLGKTYCKVDAAFGAIAVGDLLTTSPTPGHAMRADDPARAFGATIGKALSPLAAGQGMIPILIALQ